MSTPKLQDIAAELNSRSRGRPIGELQTIRAQLKQLSRKPGHNIFSEQTITDDWAFHHGGRSELQFNIGELSTGRGLRFGVGFSFQPSRSLPSPVEALTGSVHRFNDFMMFNSDDYADMRMWHFEKKGALPSTDYMPGPIPPERLKPGMFIFLGKRQPLDNIDYDVILDNLDRLLPLYKYVQDQDASEPLLVPLNIPFGFIRDARSRKPPPSHRWYKKNSTSRCGTTRSN